MRKICNGKIAKTLRQKPYKIPLNPFYVVHLLLSMGPGVKCGLYTQGDSIVEK